MKLQEFEIGQTVFSIGQNGINNMVTIYKVDEMYQCSTGTTIIKFKNAITDEIFRTCVYDEDDFNFIDNCFKTFEEAKNAINENLENEIDDMINDLEVLKCKKYKLVKELDEKIFELSTKVKILTAQQQTGAIIAE